MAAAARAAAAGGDADGGCSPGKADVAGLQAARQAFAAALSAAHDQPAASHVPEKAALGQGRADLCLSLAGGADLWAEAEEKLLSVTAAYEKGDKGLAELAAEAHAGLAAVYAPAPNAPDAADKYRRAATKYQKAIELTADDRLKANSYGALGYVYVQLQQYANADHAYEQAAQLDPERRDYYEQLRRQLPGKTELTPRRHRRYARCRCEVAGLHVGRRMNPA